MKKVITALLWSVLIPACGGEETPTFPDFFPFVRYERSGERLEAILITIFNKGKDVSYCPPYTASMDNLLLLTEPQRYVAHPFRSCGTHIRFLEKRTGTHHLRVVVDPENTLSESDKTNNIYEYQFSF